MEAKNKAENLAQQYQSASKQAVENAKSANKAKEAALM